MRTLRSHVFGTSMKLLRLATFFAVIGVIGLFVAARLAYGHAKDVAMTTGEDLLRLTDEGEIGEGYKLRLNGELVMISSATTSMSLDEVLDRFQGECSTTADGMSQEFLHLEASLDAKAQANVGFPGVGLTRQSTKQNGFVVCFATGKAIATSDGYRRVADFARSGDLGDIGSVRYVAAEALPNGGSHVVALWTEGSFPLQTMFPEQGDAPGTDLANVVRPDGSRRVFSAYAEAAPYGIRVYETSRNAAAVLAQYDAAMPALGWTPYPDVVKATPNARAFSREDVDIMVTTDEQGSSTMVSIVQMGRQEQAKK
jgi:hypothetical protein